MDRTPSYAETPDWSLGRVLELGKGLGLVTQTSLLRVFDPIEMYGVIENLQQTIQQLSVGASPGHNQLHRVAEKQKHSLGLLHTAQTYIEKILSDSEIPIEQQQFQLKSVLATLKHLDQVIQSLS